MSEEKDGSIYHFSERIFAGILGIYRESLRWVLRHQPLTLLITIATACLSVYLYIIIPKGFFPQQDTSRIGGSIIASQDISFAAMRQKMMQFVSIVVKDPAVETAVVFAGGNIAEHRSRNSATMKPRT